MRFRLVRYLCLLACAAPPAVVAAADDRERDEAAEAEKLCAAELPRWKLTADGAALDNPKEPVLRHRLVLNFHARADKVDADKLVERLLASVPQEV